MRTIRKQNTRYERNKQYDVDNDGDEINEYELFPSFVAYKSRKKSCLSLHNENYNDFTEENASRKHYKKRTHHHRTFIRQPCNEVFKCRQCRRFIGPPPSGGRQRNHCPFCLYSLHVDGKTSGDRMSTCGSRMEPIGSFQRAKGEYVLVHRCLGCGLERFNRIAADDDFERILALPDL